MINSKDYLKNKGILAEGYNHWMIRFSDGQELDLVELFDEFLQQNLQQCNVSLSLPPNIELKDIKEIRNYFGEHDATVFEHKAFLILDRLTKHLETSGGNAS